MWTDPNGHVWTTGEVVTAANMNTYVKDDLAWLGNPHRFAAWHTVPQTPASAVFQPLFFNTDIYNVGGMHSTVTNSNRGTVQSGGAGKYQIGACVNWDTNVTGDRGVSLRLNGTTYIAQQGWQTSTASGYVEQTISREYPLAVGDYVEVMVIQSSGVGVNVLSQAPMSPAFTMSWRSV